MTEEVYLFKFISLLKLSNYWHHKWKAGCTAKRVWNFLPWWAMKSRSSLFGASLEPVYYCNSVSVREKPSSYGQDSIHSPQFVVFSVFDQFSDLDLCHNIFNPIIFISNKKLSWVGLFVSFVSYLKFSSHYIQKENLLSATPHVHVEW